MWSGYIEVGLNKSSSKVIYGKWKGGMIMKQIIALGGGGFSMEPDNPLLDDYILKQVASNNPKICFIGTASGDAEGYINRFYHSFNKMECRPNHLSLFKPPTRNLQEYILEQDIIYVGGGNTKNLLILWKEWGLDQILKHAYDQEILLCGISAGAICWYEEGLTDSFGDQLEPIKALGFLKGSHSPHYDGESNRRPAYQELIKAGKLNSGVAADDGVGLHYINGELANIVSSRPNAAAYRVKMSNDRIEEEILSPRYLGLS